MVPVAGDQFDQDVDHPVQFAGLGLETLGVCIPAVGRSLAGNIFEGTTLRPNPCNIFLERCFGEQSETLGKDENGQNGKLQGGTGILPDKEKVMSGFSKMMEKDRRSICNGISNCPSVRMAYSLLFEGDPGEAKVRFQRILDDDKHNPDALAGLAICLAEDTGRFVSATKLARLSVRFAPRSPAGYYALAYIHLLGSKIEPGYRYLMKAKQLAPEDPRVVMGLVQFEGERPPVISDLPREHFLNKALGKSRSILRRGLKKMKAATP